MKHTKLTVAVSVLLGSLATGACSTVDRVAETVRSTDDGLYRRPSSKWSSHRRVAALPGRWSATVPFKPSSSSVSAGAKRHIDDLIEKAYPQAGETVEVTVPIIGITPASQKLSGRRSAALRKYIAGITKADVRVSRVPGAVGSVSTVHFERTNLLAITSCPEWRMARGAYKINEDKWRFGCVTAASLGASVVDTRDLVRGRTLSVGTGEDAARVAKADREGKFDSKEDETTTSASGSATGGGS